MPTDSELRALKSMPHLATATDARRLATVNRQLEEASAQVSEMAARLKKIDQMIHRLVTSAALTETQRAELLSLIVGTRNGRIEPRHVPNSPPEQRLVDNFRVMSSARRRAVSVLITELAREEQAHAARVAARRRRTHTPPSREAR